jgi:AraC family transcriptional regulator
MNISVAWRGLSDRWTRLAVKGAHPRSFGLQEYGADSRNRSQGILYTACVEVLPDSPVPQGAIKRTIPAGRYAVFTHTGPTEALDHTFQHVYGAGLAALGVTATGEFDLEVYDERFKEDDTNSQLDIYVPIE